MCTLRIVRSKSAQVNDACKGPKREHGARREGPKLDLDPSFESEARSQVAQEKPTMRRMARVSGSNRRE